MLSYRHGYHAGNHADVLKHLVLIQVLRYLTQKEKSLLYLDTHAATGDTRLLRGFAASSAEFQNGIGQLFGQRFNVAAIDEYLDLVTQFQAGPNLRLYPGSPAIAAKMLRPIDSMRLFEMHPRDFSQLRLWAGKQDRKIQLFNSDGFHAPQSSLPPPSRRALVLIDPAYEVKSDYRTVKNCVQESLRRLPQCTIIVWLPLVARSEAALLGKQLQHMGVDWVYCHLQLDNAVVHQLFGSAVVVLNPPFALAQQLQPVLPILAQTLGQGQKNFRLDAHIR